MICYVPIPTEVAIRMGEAELIMFLLTNSITDSVSSSVESLKNISFKFFMPPVVLVTFQDVNNLGGGLELS